MTPELKRHIYLSDGKQAALIRVVVWNGEDIYLMDPENPDSEKISYHASGALMLRQRNYEPSTLTTQLTPPSQVHRYQMVLQQGIDTHSLGTLLDRPGRFPPNERREGLLVDLTQQPAGTRFLMVEVGVRCPSTCHPDAAIPQGRFGMVRDERTYGDRQLLISAWWRRMVWTTAPPGWPGAGGPLAVISDE
jgi:hypothetical protein